MKYTMDELYQFMDAGKEVKVTTTDGRVIIGRCWAYGSVENEEEYGIQEASLDVGPGSIIYESEIAMIEMDGV